MTSAHQEAAEKHDLEHEGRPFDGLRNGRPGLFSGAFCR